MFNGPRYRGPKSDHFDGQRFLNEVPTGHQDPFKVMKWVLTRDQGSWPAYIDAPPGPPPPARVSDGRLRVTFVNHATVLVQVDGYNLLTDPVWSKRVSPVDFAGPARVRPPGLRLEDLPPIDVVLVSHNHYDHLDVATLRKLAARDRPRIITGLGNLELLEKSGIPGGVELDWWQSLDLLGLKVTGVPARHFSNRGTGDRDATLWMGFVVEGPSGRTYFAGDTGWGPHFERIRERLGPPRLALLPIGAYLPQWFMSPVHISPDEAVQAHRVLGAKTSLGIHFGTFPLADDAIDQPVRRLREVLGDSPDAADFWVLEHGEGRDAPPVVG